MPGQFSATRLINSVFIENIINFLLYIKTKELILLIVLASFILFICQPKDHSNANLYEPRFKAFSLFSFCA